MAWVAKKNVNLIAKGGNKLKNFKYIFLHFLRFQAFEIVLLSFSPDLN